MQMVYNIWNAPPLAIYIGRGSEWGNPFVIGVDGDRDEVIYRFTEYMLENLSKNSKWLEPLKDKDLMCYCAPLACHGDVIKMYLSISK